jgi:hypothetical protein
MVTVWAWTSIAFHEIPSSRAHDRLPRFHHQALRQVKDPVRELRHFPYTTWRYGLRVSGPGRKRVGDR